jgi:glutathione S-transferase
MLMLEHKGIPYRTVTLRTGAQRMLRFAGFPGGTVPAMELDDGRRIQTSRAIARALEELEPEPPLFPADPDERRAVEEAERWADEVFQMAARRIALAASLHGRDGMVNRGGSGPLGPILFRRDDTRHLGTRLIGRFVFNVNPRTERELLSRLPAQLDRIDAWIDAGVLNGDRLNAADYAVATSVALLLYRRDLRADIAARPAGALVERVLPERRG